MNHIIKTIKKTIMKKLLKELFVHRYKGKDVVILPTRFTSWWTISALIIFSLFVAFALTVEVWASTIIATCPTDKCFSEQIVEDAVDYNSDWCKRIIGRCN